MTSTDPGLTIRAAAPDDVDAVRGLMGQLADAESSDPGDVPSTRRLQHALFENPDLRLACLVADKDGEVVGAAIYVRSWIARTCEPTVRLLNLMVDLAHRREGIGARLWSALGVLAGTDARRIDFSVMQDNVGAQRFYEAVGAVPRPEWVLWHYERTDGQATAREEQTL